MAGPFAEPVKHSGMLGNASDPAYGLSTGPEGQGSAVLRSEGGTR